ncbi:immunoglobulin E-set [Polychytrium aggregatum]|uniref:immunoglobulin E-set n=1 Tax=Polychytrium aggregatum TaxID=110093 RepID=UPI0022FEAF95|nr:immunoglobulin E-set [Polychytrium aggregatum]KAI9193314.1 immunoglobulin E-set [Polychytrium aggregatum]
MLSEGKQQQHQPPAAIFEIPASLPVQFRWSLGGERVFLTGTFDNWQQTIEMKHDPECPEEFIVSVPLDTTQDHLFKFVVDGSWRCSASFPTIVDSKGNVNNILRKIPRRRLSIPASIRSPSATVRSESSTSSSNELSITNKAFYEEPDDDTDLGLANKSQRRRSLPPGGSHRRISLHAILEQQPINVAH